MQTECCFSSSGLLEMLPIYQFRLNILGVYGSEKGMAIAVHTPVLNSTREYVADLTYANVVRTAEIVRILFL
jgi:hypothetical protein